MFFARVGRFATRYHIPIILVWIATAVVVTLIAPNIENVASSDTMDFLPSDAPYAHAAEVYRQAFPEGSSLSSTVIVLDARDTGSGILNREAATFEEQIDTKMGRLIGELAAWLTGDAGPENVHSVVTPIQSPALAAVMIASETGDDPALANRVALVRVSLTTSPTEPASRETVRLIDEWLAAHQMDGARSYQTGVVPIVLGTNDSIQASAKRTIWVTVTLVVIMLLLVYRSPVSPLIPLTSVTIAYLITRGIVAYLGAHYMTITSYANVLLVAVMYGAGTDYCLFLISRFREEMADHPSVDGATAHTVHRVGETITSSASTIFVGFMAMAFAEMGLFNTSGPALALGIVLSLSAGLTLVPALLATLGDHAFWPGQATHRAAGRLYKTTSQWVSTRPLLVIVVIVVIMIPFSVYGVNQRVTYDMLADLPEERPVVVGYDLLRDSLGAGNLMPLQVVVTGRDPDQIAGNIVRLSDTIAALDGIYDVRGLDDPLGQNNGSYRNLLQVSAQLTLAHDWLNQPESTTTLDLATATRLLAGMRSYLDVLAEKFPVVVSDPNFVTLREVSYPVQAATRRDEMLAAIAGLAERFQTVENPYLLPTILSDMLAALPETSNGITANALEQLLAGYLADEGTAFRLEVIFAVSPSSYEAMDTMTQIRHLLRDYQNPGEAVASGGAAVNTDIRDTIDRDLLRAIGFVLLGIFIVLLLMLRSVIAPIYLIGTVALSYTFTLGVTNLVFKTVLGVEGLSWYVPFFAFVFLVALGIDYSIFLFGRIKEEVGNHGLREGVHVAVATTGAIITSAGIIMSGTFAATMAGEVVGLKELGFAVAFGVLVDTFVVRTVLDPALATLFGRWTWWPGGVPKSQ